MEYEEDEKSKYEERSTSEKYEEHDSSEQQQDEIKKNKKPRKKRKVQTSSPPRSMDGEDMSSEHRRGRNSDKVLKKGKKKKEKLKDKKEETPERGSLLPKKLKRLKTTDPVTQTNHPQYTPAQNAVNDMMRRALEEDQYSALGSIVDTDTSDSEEEDGNVIMTLGQANKVTAVKLDRNLLQSAVRRKLRGVGMQSWDVDKLVTPKKRKKGKKHKDNIVVTTPIAPDEVSDNEEEVQDTYEEDDSSIFDQPTGATNSTWVECDKCKKWRRLRGVVDTKKLPSKWYCAMNKNDPERSKCTAPEEDYDVPSTPESATDHRARKHLRLWVRRLQCNEAYEARQPTTVTTRSINTTTPSLPKKPNTPYEWIRCSNPSCGKWRALLRFMDVQSVLERVGGDQWYCVMNTWDEKTASCAAPQEALPAIGCPTWVRVDEDLEDD